MEQDGFDVLQWSYSRKTKGGGLPRKIDEEGKTLRSTSYHRFCAINALQFDL